MQIAIGFNPGITRCGYGIVGGLPASRKRRGSLYKQVCLDYGIIDTEGNGTRGVVFAAKLQTIHKDVTALISERSPLKIGIVGESQIWHSAFPAAPTLNRPKVSPKKSAPDCDIPSPPLEPRKVPSAHPWAQTVLRYDDRRSHRNARRREIRHSRMLLEIIGVIRLAAWQCAVASSVLTFEQMTPNVNASLTLYRQFEEKLQKATLLEADACVAAITILQSLTSAAAGAKARARNMSAKSEKKR